MSDSTSFDPRIVVRPRSLDQTVDLALAYVRVCQREFVPLFAGLTVATLVIVGLLTIGLGLDTAGTVSAVLIVSPIFERIVTVYGGRHLFGHAVPLRKAFAQTVRHIPFAIISATWVNLPWILMLLATDDPTSPAAPVAVLLAIGWPFMIASHVYLREVLLLEHLGRGKAMRRARLLASHRFERAFGLLSVSLIVRIGAALLAYSSIRFGLEFVLQFNEVPIEVVAAVTAAGWVMGGQFLALVRLFDYVDARTRREGWDIQIRFDAIKHRDDTAKARRLAA